METPCGFESRSWHHFKILKYFDEEENEMDIWDLLILDVISDSDGDDDIDLVDYTSSCDD